MKNARVRLRSIWISSEKLTTEGGCCACISSAAPTHRTTSRLQVRTLKKSGQRWDSKIWWRNGVEVLFRRRKRHFVVWIRDDRQNLHPFLLERIVAIMLN